MEQPALERAAVLANQHGWGRAEASRILAIEATNILVDATVGVSLADIRENLVIGFRQVCEARMKGNEERG